MTVAPYNGNTITVGGNLNITVTSNVVYNNCTTNYIQGNSTRRSQQQHLYGAKPLTARCGKEQNHSKSLTSAHIQEGRKLSMTKDENKVTKWIKSCFTKKHASSDVGSIEVAKEVIPDP